MPNAIKYTTGTESQALKKGNFYIGTGDVGKGPSDTTGFYQGISPSSGGYVIYMNKSGAPGDLSYHNAPTDAELISFTNSLAGQSYTTVNECLVYFAGQTDKVCVNRDYEGIVTDGLIFNLDAGFTPSYPKNGTTWYDMGGSNNGTLTNGPTFSSNDGGSIVFDGTNDYLTLGSNATSLVQGKTSVTMGILFKLDVTASLRGLIGTLNYGCRENLGLVAHFTDLSFYNDTNACFNVAINGFVETGKWIFAVGTYDGTTTRLYGFKDGIMEQTSSTTKTGATNTFNSDFRVMGNQYSTYFTDGQCIHAFIYNRALTASEVLQNYNAQKGRFGL